MKEGSTAKQREAAEDRSPFTQLECDRRFLIWNFDREGCEDGRAVLLVAIVWEGGCVYVCV